MNLNRNIQGRSGTWSGRGEQIRQRGPRGLPVADRTWYRQSLIYTLYNQNQSGFRLVLKNPEEETLSLHKYNGLLDIYHSLKRKATLLTVPVRKNSWNFGRATWRPGYLYASLVQGSAFTN